ncbi:MAG: ATP-binding protein [Parachlamydiaceae bacterium]|nr:ATP-binding protein [Parachlamydiaceae bacterium]
MSDIVTVEKKLEKLRLGGMLLTCEQRLKSAREENWSYSAFLDMLLTDEVDRRNRAQLTRRLSKSQLNLNKTLESYDFKFNLKVQAALIRELACCKFVGEGENIFLIGPSGVGKSHIAESLGHEACRRGIDVLYYRTHKLFDWIQAGRGDGSYKRRMDKIIRIPLLILDDFGLQSMEPSQQEDLYEVICERYEKKAMIITSNRDMTEWTAVFSNPLIGSAAMDRLVHKGMEIIIDGDSYRLDQFKKKTGLKKK